MQNGKHTAVSRLIQKLVGVPTGGERSGFGLAIAYHATYEQVRVVERGAKRVRDAVSEFTTFMNRAGRFRRDVAGNPSGERELLEEPSQAIDRLRDVRVDFAVGALEISIGDKSRPTVPGSSYINDVEIVLFDQPVE